METLDRKRNVSSIVESERQMFSQVSQQRRRREADPTEGRTSGPARLHSCLLVFVRFSVSGLAIRQQMALRPTSLLRRPPAALLSNHSERATRLGQARVRCNARLPTSGWCTAPPKIGFQCRHTLPIDRNANSSTSRCERIPLLTWTPLKPVLLAVEEATCVPQPCDRWWSKRYETSKRAAENNLIVPAWCRGSFISLPLDGRQHRRPLQIEGSVGTPCFSFRADLAQTMTA